MDKSIVAVEESHRRSDSPASASKSLESIVQINSIAIDLSCAMEEIESPVHEHFSIRGFVAGLRKKDWKMCLPFASEGDDDNDLVDNLPPLSVPRFRWWQCSNCVPDIAAERTIADMLLADRNDPGTSSCQHVGGEKDGLFSNSIRNIGGDHSRDSMNGEDDDPSNKTVNSNPCCTEGRKAAICGKVNTDVKHNEVGNSCVYVTEANRYNNNADASDMVHIAENPSIRFDEPENASSGSDGACSALPHRRKPKLRSLADIMEEEKNSKGEHIRTRSTLSNGMQVTSTEKEADLDPQLQLDAVADVATGTRSPHRKRKIAVEEDRGTLEPAYPVSTAKRLKGPISDLEKTCKIVEVSDSESGGDGSAGPDLQLSAKTQQIKPKRNKALDVSRKMKQTHIDNRTVPIREVPNINAVHSANLQKCAVSAEMRCGNMGHVPSALREEMAPHFNNFVSGKQVDRTSDLSKIKRPEVAVDHSPLIPARKSFLGDCNSQGKVALDLSLNSCMSAERNSDNQTSCRQHTGIPDLNESFIEKPSTTQGKQLPTLSENKSSALHKNLDTSTSCSKQMVREGKRQFGVSEPQAVQKMHNSVEPCGTSDDIPMEIVELLAKNQRERALGNSRNHLLPESINNSIRGSPSVYVDGCAGMINFPLTNARGGINVSSGKTGAGQGILSFPQVKNYPLDTGNLEESQFTILSSFKPSQLKRAQYSASNSIMSGPRPSEGADLLWPPRRKNTPFHLDVCQNRSVQPNGLGHSFSDQSYKGKTISDMKGDEKKAMRDASMVKEGRIGSSSKPAGSLDAYSNDTIPAMQLLSLMDRGIVSGSSFKVCPNSFLDKPFSPCNHHPRLNGNENQNDPFLSTPFFSQSSHTKDFPALLNSIRYSGQMPPQQGNARAFHLEGPSNLVTQPSRGNLALKICSLNRNPADFSIPDAKNEFTISAKDLKSRKRNSLKERSRDVNVEGQKRRKARKDASGKECSRK